MILFREKDLDIVSFKFQWGFFLQLFFSTFDNLSTPFKESQTDDD